MDRKTNLRADAVFEESNQKRVKNKDRAKERAKKAWNRARREESFEKSSEYVDMPEYRIMRHTDADTGKVSYELTEGTRRIVTPHVKGLKRLKKRAYYEASGVIHQTIGENEGENAGVETAKKAENEGKEAAENLKRMIPDTGIIRRKLQRELLRKEEQKKKAENGGLFQKEVSSEKAKQNQSLVFTGEVSNDNEFIKSSRRSKNKYARREANAFQKEEKKAVKQQMKKRSMRGMQRESAKREQEIIAIKAAEAAAVGTVAKEKVKREARNSVNEYVLLIRICLFAAVFFIALVILLLFFILTQVSLQNELFAGLYQSDPKAIEEAELRYSYLEACLSEYMHELEEREEGYDGYVIDEAAGIGHNPYTLINYLSAKYVDFTNDEVKDEIEDLYRRSYTITTWVEDIEVDPPAEEETSEEGEDEEEDHREPMILHILHIKLTKIPLEELVAERMNEEESERYALYGETRGGFATLKSPTGDDFMSRISSFYGFRYHPIRHEIRLHRGLDIAVPEGTPIYAAVDGMVVTVREDPDGYGKYITIEDEHHTSVRYGHLSEFEVSEGQSVKSGDEIGKSGNTGASTGPHVHVEVLMNGEYYNPYFYLDTE